MGFAGTAFAQQDDVALVIEIITRCQVQHCDVRWISER
jgi:hypothetical protein